ncbi:MAG: glycosyltransferase family 4 protein [Bacteroidetes bacterium]|nr:glycosyltransferase family 4 protein [Bacteroidota bacterium]
MKSRTIFYIQHANALGGSVVSLRELIIDAKGRGYHCVVIAPNETIATVYREIGAESYVCDIAAFQHNTVIFYKFRIKDILRFGKSVFKTLLSFVLLHRLITKSRPDLVHLNSSTLIQYVPYFWVHRVPVVLHIRENIAKGYFGIRKAIMRRLADRLTCAIIYISEYELEILQTNRKRSLVIYNYVHEQSFLDDGLKHIESIDQTKKTIIALGGLHKIKGGDIILESLRYINDAELFLLGCADPRIDPEGMDRSDGTQYVAKLSHLLDEPSIGSKVRFVGRVSNPASYIGTCSLLVFWAASPHFPRPVFEAWLLKKPVVYFNPDFKSDVLNENTVHIVVRASPIVLAETINNLNVTNYQGSEMQKLSYMIASERFTEKNFEAVERIYSLCVND